MAKGLFVPRPESTYAGHLAMQARLKGIALTGTVDDVGQFVKANKIDERIVAQVRTAVPGGTVGGSDYGPIAGSNAGAIGAFQEFLRATSAFYEIHGAGGFTAIPFRKRVGICTLPATGYVVPEGEPVPVSRLGFANVLLEPVRVQSIVVATIELLRDVSSGAQALFSRELRGAIGDAVDAWFFGTVLAADTDGIDEITSDGPTAPDACYDLERALAGVTSLGNPALYLVVAPDVARRAACLGTLAGSAAFADMTPSGGTMCGVPVLVSSAIAPGTLYALNARGFAANAGDITVDASTAASLHMNDSPTSPADLLSLFQTNAAALRATAMVGAQRLRDDDNVSVVTGIAWSTTGGSV